MSYRVDFTKQAQNDFIFLKKSGLFLPDSFLIFISPFEICPNLRIGKFYSKKDNTILWSVLFLCG